MKFFRKKSIFYIYCLTRPDLALCIYMITDLGYKFIDDPYYEIHDPQCSRQLRVDCSSKKFEIVPTLPTAKKMLLKYPEQKEEIIKLIEDDLMIF